MNKSYRVKHIINKSFFFFYIVVTLGSCLVTVAPKTNYFSSVDSSEKSNPKLQIFSTPKYKSYVVTKVDMDAQVFIQSPIFENPNEFYLMKNEAFFGSEAKQYELEKRDSKFYKTDDFKNVTLKVFSKESEKAIVYKLEKN